PGRARENNRRFRIRSCLPECSTPRGSARLREDANTGLRAWMRRWYRASGGREELGRLAWIRQLDFNQPSRAVRIFVESFRRLRKQSVDLHHFSRNRGVNIADSLDGFHRTDGLALLDHSTGFGKIHIHDVAQFAL